MHIIVGIVVVLIAFGWLKSRVNYMGTNGRVGVFCLLVSGVTYLLSLLFAPILYLSLALLFIVGITVIVSIYKAIFVRR